MRPRLVVLLLVTIVSGVVAGFVGQAKGGHTKTAVLRPPKAVYGQCPIPAKFRSAFERAERLTGLPLALLAAVANVESTFNPDARSTAGAHGLFQILPSTAKELKLDISTPEKNVIAGARYLKILLNEFQSTDLMLAAYNAGPTAVIKAGGAPNAASLVYVNEVMRLWRSLNGCK
jgi:soluble lytic murein transglycosylase-like protein